MFEGAGQRVLTLIILISLGWLIYSQAKGKNILESIRGKMGGGGTTINPPKITMLGKVKP